MSVVLKPWRGAAGAIEQRDLRVRWTPVLPYAVWRMAFPAGRVIALLVERDGGDEKNARLIAWLGPRPAGALEEAKRDWLAERTLTDPRFGAFHYDERLDWFEVRTAWLGQGVSLTLEGDEQGDHRTALSVAHDFFDAAARWDAAARDAIVAELLPLKNDSWLDQGEAPVTAAAFLAALTLTDVTVNERQLILHFEDGDLFYGHTIVATIDGEQGGIWAEIEG